MPAAEVQPLPALFDPHRHMQVSEVKPGMTGYGLSVFSGTKIERFDVEVISVLKNFNPGTDVVLIRCHGANLEHTGSIAGMSGSPIYLKDDQGSERLIGAFAYGWPMAKDPLAGVQPIQYMLAAPPAKPPVAADPNLDAGKPNTAPTAQPRVAARWSLSEVKLPAWSDDQKATALSNGVNTSRLAPLATPLSIAGISPQQAKLLAPLFAGSGLTLLQGGASAAATADSSSDVSMAPGAVLAVPLLIGDADLTTIGTCTEVLGDRVFGFGHPFQNEGSVLLPMGGGMIHTVVANLNTSMKLGSMTTRVGRLVSDRAVGISGQKGEFPQLAPIDLHVSYSDGSFDRQYHFEAVVHPRFTPMLSATALSSAVNGANDLPQYHTLDYDLKLEFANGQTINVRNAAVNTSPQDLFNTIALPIVSASDNPFGQVLMKRVTGEIRVTPEAREGRILDVSVPRSKYRPGETVHVFVREQPFRQGETIMPADMELPANIPDGTYQLVVSDWQRFMADEMVSKPFRFTAQSVDEMFDVLRDYTGARRNALYLRLIRQPDGLAIGRTAFPQLPSSRRQIMLGANRSNTTRFVSSTTKVIPTELVMSGAAEFVLTVDSGGAESVGDAATPSAAQKRPDAPPSPQPVAPAKGLPGTPTEPKPGPPVPVPPEGGQ